MISSEVLMKTSAHRKLVSMDPLLLNFLSSPSDCETPACSSITTSIRPHVHQAAARMQFSRLLGMGRKWVSLEEAPESWAPRSPRTQRKK